MDPSRPLTAGEQQQWKKGISEAREPQAKLLAKRQGKRFPDSSAVITDERDKRTRELMRAADK